MKVSIFSVQQANRLAHEITPKVEELVRLRGEITGLEREMAIMPLVLAGATRDNADAAGARQLVARRTELSGRLRGVLKAVQDRGCFVKDLDRGVVDFYALMGDRLIFLCWHLGEAEVSHWHSLEGGFTSRQPLNHTEMD